MVQLLAQLSNGVQVLGVDYADVRRHVVYPTRIVKVDFVDPETLEVICGAEVPEEDQHYEGHLEVYKNGHFLGAITLTTGSLSKVKAEVDQLVGFFNNPDVVPDINEIDRGYRVFVQQDALPYHHIVEVQGKVYV